MTVFFFVRHGTHPLVDSVLAGRMSGVSLGDDGREQALRVAERLAGEKITALQSSPQQRAQETAAPIAARLSLPVEITSAIDEIDFGNWAGRSFSALAADPLWRLWNSRRGSARPPGGESMRELQERVRGHLNSMFARAPDGQIVLVSHAEVIRAAALGALGLPLDDFQRVDIAPGSISTIAVNDSGARVIALNQVAP